MTIIHPTALVADGAEIGADVKIGPYSIVGGNPAKLIRKRFDQDTIEHLLNLAWWDWTVDKITQHAKALAMGDEQLFK